MDSTPPTDTLRFAHFSDVHLTVKPLGWTAKDLASKKVTGWVNVKLLGRGARFKHAPKIVDLMRQEFVSRKFDHLVFSGDATKLAFEREFAFAAQMLGVKESVIPGICIPGNHDYYTRKAAKGKLFEKHFAPWLEGKRIGDRTYPFAQKAGHAWLIAVNSSTANWWTFDASGAIGDQQFEDLKALCKTLGPGPRILVTHYPLRDRDRTPERRSHRLRDHEKALAVTRDCGIGLWLHGHIHKPYYLAAGDDLPFPTICAGSGTQTNRWCWNDCTLRGHQLEVQQRLYDFDNHRYTDGYRAELVLPSAR